MSYDRVPFEEIEDGHPANECPSCAAKDAEIARLRKAVEFATRNNVGQVIDSEFARNVRKMAGMEG